MLDCQGTVDNTSVGRSRKGIPLFGGFPGTVPGDDSPARRDGTLASEGPRQNGAQILRALSQAESRARFKFLMLSAFLQRFRHSRGFSGEMCGQGQWISVHTEKPETSVSGLPAHRHLLPRLSTDLGAHQRTQICSLWK